MNPVSTDQTRFSIEKPLFEQMVQIPVEEPEQPQRKVPLLKQKKFVIALIAGMTLLMLMILFVVNAYIEQQKRVQEMGQPEASISPNGKQSHPLLSRIETIQKELKDADPSQQDLIYPTMDYGLRLDSKD